MVGVMGSVVPTSRTRDHPEVTDADTTVREASKFMKKKNYTVQSKELNETERTVSTSIMRAFLTPCLPLACDGGFPVANVCAWCNRDLPVKFVDRLPGKITHGMCPQCLSEQLSECQNPNCHAIISDAPTDEQKENR
jgi:hypothetical protein